ncbi:MAG: lipid A biosynthesis acyltransferase, partial [Verrucomicrobia bacterium]
MSTKVLHAHRWAALPERGTPASLRLIAWIALHVGRWAARLLLYPITLYFVVSGHAARRVSYDYLRRVGNRRPRWWHVFRHFHCFAATILDRVYLLRGEFEHFNVTLHGKEMLHRQMETDRGCILLGAHLGSFEVLRTLGVTQRNFPLKVLMDVEHNQNVTRFLDALNDKTTECQFLGAPAVFPAGPILLAGMMHCPIILFFGLYRGGKRYDIYFEQFAHEIILNREHRTEEIHDWMQRYARRLEHYARLAPY